MKEFWRFFNPENACTPFYISLAGITYPDPSYHVKANCRTVSVIEYVVSGKGYVLANGEIHEVGPDTIYFLKKGEQHDYFSDKNNPFTKIFLNISGPLAKDLSSLYDIDNIYFFKNKELLPVFEEIPKILKSSRDEDEIQSALQGILAEILARLCYDKNKKQHSKEAIKLKSYLDSNQNRLISNSELSKVIFRSTDYCQKLFIREFNDTPYSYQLKQKMLVAKSRLANTKMSVGDIGYSLGYKDPHYFSNIFQSKCGCRPLAYRKREQIKNESDCAE